MTAVLRIDPDLGRIFVPEIFSKRISLPGQATRRFAKSGELGIFVATQKRWNASKRTMETIWSSISHNERVNRGSSIQANRVFGTVGTTAVGVFSAIAIASANITKTATDLGLGQATGGSTITNEFSTIGLSRTAGTVQNLVAASTLGGTFSVDIYKSFSVTGTGTAYGAGLFDSTTPTGSNLYVEDLFTTSSASLLSGDTLNVTITITN